MFKCSKSIRSKIVTKNRIGQDCQWCQVLWMKKTIKLCRDIVNCSGFAQDCIDFYKNRFKHYCQNAMVFVVSNQIR